MRATEECKTLLIQNPSSRSSFMGYKVCFIFNAQIRTVRNKQKKRYNIIKETDENRSFAEPYTYQIHIMNVKLKM